MIYLLTIDQCSELSDSFDWASYLMEGIEYPTYSDSDEVCTCEQIV